jgi:hypothetical protein
MFRKASVEQVGGYHAAFRHCEDYDLWVRLASVTKLASLPERLLQYRHTEGQISNRHLVEQQTGVAASQLAYQLRKAGRPDPTQNLERLPPIEDYDALFGPGASIKARAIAASSVLYSDVALRGDGFAIVLNHIRDGNHVPGLKRTILRLLRFGEPARAMTMATALLLR